MIAVATLKARFYARLHGSKIKNPYLDVKPADDREKLRAASAVPNVSFFCFFGPECLFMRLLWRRQLQSLFIPSEFHHGVADIEAVPGSGCGKWRSHPGTPPIQPMKATDHALQKHDNFTRYGHQVQVNGATNAGFK